MKVTLHFVFCVMLLVLLIGSSSADFLELDFYDSTADFDLDGSVDTRDFELMSRAWSLDFSDPNILADERVLADLNFDYKVDLEDIIIFSQYWLSDLYLEDLFLEVLQSDPNASVSELSGEVTFRMETGFGHEIFSLMVDGKSYRFSEPDIETGISSVIINTLNFGNGNHEFAVAILTPTRYITSEPFPLDIQNEPPPALIWRFEEYCREFLLDY